LKKLLAQTCRLGDFRMVRGVAFAVTLFLQNVSIPLQSQPPQKTSIEGAVLKIGSSEPVAGAHVTLIRANANPNAGTAAGFGNSNLLESVTDSLGKFVFKEVESGLIASLSFATDS